MDVESLIRVCVSGFTAEDIKKAKRLLFEAVPAKKRNISRRRDGKMQREVEDIICLFQNTDPEKLPIFVARDLQKLPPLTFDHVDVTRLLKDLLILKADVKNIKETYVMKEDFMKSVRGEHSKIDLRDCSPRGDYVNTKRGACLSESCYVDSGPIGLPPIVLKSSVNESAGEQAMTVGDFLNVSNSTSAISVSPLKVTKEKQVASIEFAPNNNNQLTAGSMNGECIANTQGQDQQSIPLQHSANTAMHPYCTPRACNLRPTAVSNKPVGLDNNRVQSVTQAHQDVPLIHRMHSDSSDLVLDRHVERPTAVSTVTFADILKSSEKPKEEEWIKVTYKSKIKNKFKGNKGKGSSVSNGSFKAAEVKIPFYIYNVDKGASISDIKRHIYEKTNVSVELTKIKMKQDKQYEAYKFDIPHHKLSVFMDENMWPEGIAFRRYIYFKGRRADSAQANGTEAKETSNNG
ncbi:uncharacterized protein LOC120636910 [Pararge aegeria]|uniref:uncharacterized protein LOC120636910 n=1 Tax=Pararge aegeria TaxID=116150 RepID=UPI0019D0523A|nr:uncharacterized protein LOC120636910 [Pararge aegeria]